MNSSITLKQGIKNLIVAGGETSGVVTQALGVQGFYIGPQIAPGVPWVKAIDQDFSLALKSGNFGDEAFFILHRTFSRDGRIFKRTNGNIRALFI